MLKALFNLFRQPEPPDSVWRPCRFRLPVRLEDGQWSDGTGQIWRRKQDGRWIYRQDEETDEEFWERQI